MVLSRLKKTLNLLALSKKTSASYGSKNVLPFSFDVSSTPLLLKRRMTVPLYL